jgi:NTP pyrophosphatase (non-canonical NTP hydrolase)
MEMNEAQKEAVELLEQINKKLKIKHNPDGMFLNLVEEVGEVARELSKKQDNYRENFDREKLADELSDIISRVFIIAEDNKINLDKAYERKLKKVKERFEIK